MDRNFIDQLFALHLSEEPFPSSKEICEFTSRLLQVLFPSLANAKFSSSTSLHEEYQLLQDKLLSIFYLIQTQLNGSPEKLTFDFFKDIPEVYEKMLTDIDAIVKGDPAARSHFEVVRSYPGFLAIAMYRIAHHLYQMNIPVIPRIITEYAHSKTGIDIHPGADIAPHFCIDHGTGIVIGETTIIGRNVKLYQGVTLGALSVDKMMAQTKRHPTIEDNVVIYSNATILGGTTVVGNNSIIGGNVWITKSVPPNSVVYHKPQITVADTKHKTDI